MPPKLGSQGSTARGGLPLRSPLRPGPAGRSSPRPSQSHTRPDPARWEFRSTRAVRRARNRPALRPRRASTERGEAAVSSARPPRPRGHATQPLRQPRPTRPRLPEAGQSLTSAARRAPPGRPAGHAQCGSEPRAGRPRVRPFPRARAQGGGRGAGRGRGVVRADAERAGLFGTLALRPAAPLRLSEVRDSLAKASSSPALACGAAGRP